MFPSGTCRQFIFLLPSSSQTIKNTKSLERVLGGSQRLGWETLQYSLLFFFAQSWAIMKADAEESRVLASRLALEAERAQRGEEEAQRQAGLLEEALESLQDAENPHLSLHQLQLLHRLPLEAVCSLQAQLCTCLRTVEQVRDKADSRSSYSWAKGSHRR